MRPIRAAVACSDKDYKDIIEKDNVWKEIVSHIEGKSGKYKQIATFKSHIKNISNYVLETTLSCQSTLPSATKKSLKLSLTSNPSVFTNPPPLAKGIIFPLPSSINQCKQFPIGRGENSYSSGNVIKMSFDPSITPVLLTGEVRASMKGRRYNVELFVDPEDGITDAKCTCPRGQVICHHMAALCVHAHHNVSVTDKAYAWNAPRKNSDMEKTKSLHEMFPPKEPNYCFIWLLQAEPKETLLLLVPQIENIVFSTEYIASENKVEYFKEKCMLSKENIKQIAEAARGQSSNENWLIARKHRLTASHFGVWGRENEAIAIETIKVATGMEVFPTEIWLEDFGYIGANPDGLVGKDALIIEVKCPFARRGTTQ
ncbi:hypothetical protein NQ314_014064 [Rhamnusium bicolor]|uniref:SWIM-type domain-containing protein n=1 Tax=Rhamnusium bicolor TaxID=1586634 RepID=A0AAV8X3I8_9CUCU|nr:hypothetical protein NQ314_014064 [Rhamnusium bicolor]